MTPLPRPRGTTLGLVRRLTRDPLGELPLVQQECGDIWLVDVPWLPTVMVAGPELVHAVLVKESRQYRKDYYTQQLQRVLGQGLLLAEGETWRRHRRLAQPAFHTSAIRGYARVMAESTVAATSRWGARQQLDVHAEMMRLTLEIVARTLFGHDIGEDAAIIGHALDTFMLTFRGIGNTGLLLPDWLPTPQNLRQHEALAQMDRIVYGMVERYRKDSDPHTLLGMLLAATDEQGGLTDQQLRDEAVTLLLAGHETTAVTLTVALYLISQHPNVEARLQAEADAALAARGGGPLDHDDLARLPYHRAVILEAQRLYPPVWAIGRETLQDTMLGGYRVPRGSHLWLVPWLLHRDARWFTDPLSFRPERWEDGTLQKQLPDGAFFPFGAGPRVCIGKRFAELEAVLVLAQIVGRYALRLSPGETLRLLPSVTLRPERGLSMVASLRTLQQRAA